MTPEREEGIKARIAPIDGAGNVVAWRMAPIDGVPRGITHDPKVAEAWRRAGCAVEALVLASDATSPQEKTK